MGATCDLLGSESRLMEVEAVHVDGSSQINGDEGQGQNPGKHNI